MKGFNKDVYRGRGDGEGKGGGEGKGVLVQRVRGIYFYIARLKICSTIYSK